MSGALRFTNISYRFSVFPEYLNLYDNRFSGTIPRNLRLRDLYYFDIGRNRIVGTIPEDLGDKFVGLRYLHIDNNRLSGTIPESKSQCAVFLQVFHSLRQYESHAILL